MTIFELLNKGYYTCKNVNTGVSTDSRGNRLSYFTYSITCKQIYSYQPMTYIEYKIAGGEPEKIFILGIFNIHAVSDYRYIIMYFLFRDFINEIAGGNYNNIEFHDSVDDKLINFLNGAFL